MQAREQRRAKAGQLASKRRVSRRPRKSLFGGKQIPPLLTRQIAYVMIAISVGASWWMAGTGSVPFPVAVGITILAVIRLLIVRREDRLEAQNSGAQNVCSLN